MKILSFKSLNKKEVKTKEKKDKIHIQKRRWSCDFPPRKTPVGQKHRAISRQEKLAYSTPRRVVLGLPSSSPRVCREAGRTLTSQPEFLASIGYQISLANGSPLGGAPLIFYRKEKLPGIWKGISFIFCVRPNFFFLNTHVLLSFSKKKTDPKSKNQQNLRKRKFCGKQTKRIRKNSFGKLQILLTVSPQNTREFLAILTNWTTAFVSISIIYHPVIIFILNIYFYFFKVVFYSKKVMFGCKSHFFWKWQNCNL